jgi:serine/arginine repetitive matrix protein 2
MSSYRTPDNRYPRDRSPYRENRDRRLSGFGRGYPPRENENIINNNNNSRPNNDPNAFQPRDAPRGPKSLVDTSRGPPLAPTSGVPSGPRETPRDIPRDTTRDVPRDITRDGPHEGRGRGFAGRGEAPSLRDAPPLGNGNHTGNHWRPGPERDRAREFDRRDRRPSPRRSPIRDSRDSRDFVPRDLDINRARRNSRDGPPSAGSTYSDPPLGTGSTYRGSGRGRGIGRDFGGDMRGRGGRNFHVDDRDRHDTRDRLSDRAYRPRSRSRDPIRRERDVRDLRDDREFDRRDRDDRGFRPGYDSYVGPASSIKPGMRTLDTHRGSGAPDARHIPATPTGPTTPHLSHHPSTGDRLGPPIDTYPRRSSIAVEPSSAKDARRESEQNSLLAIRAEASRERYAPRASSPPAAVPAFGFSNVWRNPALDAKPTAAVHVPKPVSATPSVPVVPAPLSAPPMAPVIPTAPKVGVSSGPPAVQPSASKAPPTGPKADRVPDRPQGDSQSQDSRPLTVERPRIDAPLRPPPIPTVPPKTQASENVERKPAPPVPAPAPVLTQAPVLAPPPPLPAHSTLASVPAPVVAPTAPSVPAPPQAQAQAPPQPPVQPQAYATSPPLGPAARIRAPPTGPQASLRQNVSPSFARPSLPAPYAQRDVSPVTAPLSGFPRNSMLTNTSPKSMPAYIPTGPKADRTNQMGPRPPMYPPNDRPGFAASSNFPPPRMPMGSFPKSHQWVNPVLNRPSTIPMKREYPVEDRERSFGTASKAPKLEGNSTAIEPHRPEQHGPQSPIVTRTLSETDRPKERAASGPPKVPSPKPAKIEIRRMSDVSMPDASPRTDKIPDPAPSSANAMMDDSDDDLDLDEDDFAESEAKYEREKAHLEAKFVELNTPHLRATTPLQEIMLLASLTIDHLPRQETKPADEEMASPPSVQLQPESVTAELLTPQAEEPEDIAMEEKEEKPLAPATQALRLRREASPKQEPVQDYSSLPYLGSGPPTPLSDLEQDRPSLPESVMLAIRSNLRKEIEPARDPDHVLRHYANVYRQWRMHIRDFDDVQDPEDLERQPSIEPGLKVTTPDPQSAAMAAMMDGPSTTGRRSHSSRWATELDFEQVLKESLKTAEEEKNGKKKEEPRKSMSDPEREATVPLELTAYDVQRRRFIDTNFQREPGQGIFVYHYEPPEDDFTEAEHKIMVSHYKDQYAKKWGKLAEMLWNEAGTERTYKDCINHYYATKWGREYKGKARGRRGGARKRGGGAGRGRGNIANVDRSEVTNDDGSTPLPVTDTGRPRRSAAPQFGIDPELDTATSTPTPGRLRRQTDADGTQEKIDRRRKSGKEKIGRKPKAQVLAAAPVGSPVKIDRKEKPLGVKTEEDFGKRSLGEMPLPIQMQQIGVVESQIALPSDLQVHSGLSVGDGMERSRPQANNTRPGPSSYWSVTEQNDFQRNVAHFGTDWVSIANHMGTKTHTMVRNQYLRLVEGGLVDDLQKLADEADHKRERGEDLGPPPTPTPAPKRRYESSSTTVPRTLAPTPEVADLLKSPGMLPIAPPQASPQSIPVARPITISQPPLQAKPHVPSSSSIPTSESAHVMVPSMSQQQSPPIQPPRAQPPHQHQHTLSQQKPQHVPRAGYFSDDQPRVDNRPPSQSSSMAQPPRTIQQQIQSHNRTQEPSQTPLFRTPVHQEREPQHRMEQQQDHDPHMRFSSHHSRRISQEHTHQRLFQSHVSGPGQMMSQMRSAPSAGSPENRPLSFHQSRYMSQAQPSSQLNVETAGQASIVMPGVLQHPSRSAIGTPPMKEEHRQYSMPQVSQPQVPQPQVSQPQVSQPQVSQHHVSQPQAPSQLHTKPQGHPQLAQPSVQVAPAKAIPKPASEPRKSNLLSLLNDTEPEEPRRKKPVEQSIPSHTSTPQQQTPIAPPPPSVSQALPQRNSYNDVTTTQGQYERTSYAPQASLSQAPSSRHYVDLTSEPSGARLPHSREGWQQQRQQFHSGQSQSQQGSAANSPHVSLAQPTFGGETRIYNHRSLLAQANAPRHQPSPPPLSAFNNPPQMHSRTSSLSGAQPQQSRHGISNATPVQHSQAPGSNQILQPNPYAQVDPTGNNLQSSAPVGMRPSPHLHTSHVAQPREHQGRNEQAQIHNGALNYPNPHVLSENHPAHQHLRGPSVSEQYRRDPRELNHDFDPRNPQRDMAMELSNRTETLLREQQRESLMGRSTATPSGHQEHRYQPPQQERGYATQQRSHTPLSRVEHGQHAPLQHPPHSSLANDSHPIYGQRQQQEEPPQRFRNPFPPQNERERFPDRAREEQAQQQHQVMRGDEYGREREIREREMRERDARYREEVMREREAASRGGGPPPPTGPAQHAQNQRQGSSASNVDWANMARQQQERWQQR